MNREDLLELLRYLRRECEEDGYYRIGWEDAIDRVIEEVEDNE